MPTTQKALRPSHQMPSPVGKERPKPPPLVEPENPSETLVGVDSAAPPNVKPGKPSKPGTTHGPTIKYPEQVRDLRTLQRGRSPTKPFRHAMVDANLFPWQTLPPEVQDQVRGYVEEQFRDDVRLDRMFRFLRTFGGSSLDRKYRMAACLFAFERLAVLSTDPNFIEP